MLLKKFKFLLSVLYPHSLLISSHTSLLYNYNSEERFRYLLQHPNWCSQWAIETALHYTKSMLGKVCVCVKHSELKQSSRATVNLFWLLQHTVNAAFHSSGCRKAQSHSPCSGFYCAVIACENQCCVTTVAAEPSQKSLSRRFLRLRWSLAVENLDMLEWVAMVRAGIWISEDWEWTEIPSMVMVTQGKSLGKENLSVASRVAVLDLEGLCSDFISICIPDVLAVEGQLHGTCSGSEGRVYLHPFETGNKHF